MGYIPDNSDYVRMMVNTIIAEANLTESDFALRLRGTLGASTVGRLLKTSQELSQFHRHVLLDAASRIAGVPAARLQIALRGSFSPVLLPEIELTVAKCLSAGNSELAELMKEVKAAEGPCAEKIVFRPNLPLFLLEDELAQRVVEYLTTRYARNSELAKNLIQENVAQRREAFMDSEINAHRKLVVILPMSRLLSMTEMKGPFFGCTHDQIGASLGSLLHDAILGRDVTLVVVNDVVNPLARAWVANYESFRTIALFGSQLLLKRREKTLVYRVFKATDGQRAREIIEFHRQDLHYGMRLACHGLGKFEIAEFLQKFMYAAGYRLPRRYGFN